MELTQRHLLKVFKFRINESSLFSCRQKKKHKQKQTNKQTNKKKKKEEEEEEERNK
jgi:hypothetical protein